MKTTGSFHFVFREILREVHINYGTEDLNQRLHCFIISGKHVYKKQTDKGSASRPWTMIDDDIQVGLHVKPPSKIQPTCPVKARLGLCNAQRPFSRKKGLSDLSLRGRSAKQGGGGAID